jgi:acetolactate synthase-1/2/3 large subunit
MVVLACGIRRDTGRAFQLHDVDQFAMARPVTKVQFQATQASEIYPTIRRACQIARSSPAGPVIVEIPAEHYMLRHSAELQAPDEQAAPLEARQEEVDRACTMLEASRRPLLYLGLGAADAGVNLVSLAESLNAPVATTIQGKGVFNEKHPLWLWCGFGASAPPLAQTIADSCDLTLAIGCRFSEVGTGSYGLQPPGKLIHVDIDPSVFGKNYLPDLAVASDSGLFVEKLLKRLRPRPVDEELSNQIRFGHDGIWKEWANYVSDKVDPPYLLRALQANIGDDAIYTTDSGNGTFLAMECLRLERPRSFLAPVDYSCMGYAVPAALGATLACPRRQVVALAGDGAFLMTGLELLTASQLQLPVMVLVLRDRELAQIAQFQQIALGRKSCSELPDYDLAGICRGVGVEYLAMHQNADVESTLAKALAVTRSNRPVVVEVAIEYSRKTYFTRGVVRTNFGRLPWPDRIRYVARALGRKLT